MSAAFDLRVVHPTIRRFDTADFSLHAEWLLPRLTKAYPHLNDRGAATFLQNIIYNNEYLFLYLPDSIALAQVLSAHALTGSPLIYERFVWCVDPDNKEQQEHASEFYREFYRWAKQQNVETIIVEENTDVPHELIKKHLGRIYTRQQQFCRT